MRGSALLVLAVAVIHLILIQPNHPEAVTWGALRLFPLELPLVLLVLLATPPGLRLPVRIAATAVLALVPVVKLADYAAFLTYSRGFNLVLDAHLLPSAWALARGSVGTGQAALGLAAALAAVALLAVLAWWATGRVMAAAPGPRWRPALAIAALPALGLVVADAAPGSFDPPGAAYTTRLSAEHVAKVAATQGDLARFRAEAARDAFAEIAADRLLAELRGHDVLLLFVESYGRSALENPRYAPTIRPRLAAIETALREEGLVMRSGWLTAPMSGGQSWLAHASVLSGLTISDQRRYAALLASPRQTLLHFARQAGWRTVAVMPAITLPWPEGGYFGYEATYPAAKLGYSGLPFNWVTMPDQFTLRALERLELEASERPPVFAEVALISSHAPWTPIPELVPWEAVGDGRVFDTMATSGDPPEVVWRDRDRVRDGFRRALDYALEVVGSFAERRAGTAPLLVVLGDHEPAPMVSERPESFDVPVHVIGPPELVEKIEGWGWTPGLLPEVGLPAWPMAAFRDRFLAAFTPEAPGNAKPQAKAVPAEQNALPTENAH